MININRVIYLSTAIIMLSVAGCFAAENGSIYSDLDQKSSRWADPSNPRIGDRIQFRYTRDSETLPVMPEHIEIMIGIYPGGDQVSLPMHLEDQVWRAEWTITDTLCRLILFSFVMDTMEKEIWDNNGNAYYELRVFGRNGQPLKGAYLESALTVAGFESDRTEDLEFALEQLRRENKLYPEDYSTRLLRYTIMLRGPESEAVSRERIRLELEELEKQYMEDSSFLEFAIQAYGMISDSKEALRMQEKLERIDPDSRVSTQNRLSLILEIEDTKSRIHALEQFIQDSLNVDFEEAALSQLAAGYIELKDSTALIRIGDCLMIKAGGLNGASALAAITGYLAENSVHLDKAIEFSNRAVELVRQSMNQEPPQGLSKREWQQQLARSKAHYLDLSGWAQAQYGQIESGIINLKLARQTLFEPGVFYHIGKAYQMSGATDSALVYYSRASAFGGEIGNLAYNALTDLWAQSGRDRTTLNAFQVRQENWIEKQYKKRILSEKEIRPAPDFELMTTDGDLVRLSDQDESAIVLSFWATWSRSSLKMLRQLQELSSNLGDRVLFLNVAMDTDQNKIHDFVDKTGFYLPVLFNEGLEKTYDLQGVPVLYVINSEGMIHFEHRGFRPDIQQVLATEINSLLE